MTTQNKAITGERTAVRVESGLPLEHTAEYDGAAKHFALTGQLPQLMGSPGALDFINSDPESFFERVRAFEYARVMNKLNEEG